MGSLIAGGSIASQIAGPMMQTGAAVYNNERNIQMQDRTNQMNLQAVRETNANNLELANYQYEKNLEQWHRENQYNSPSSQMARLRAAGLNPALVYGSNANPVSSPSPQYDAPKMEAGAPLVAPRGSVDVIGPGIQQLYNNIFRERELSNKESLINSQVQANEAKAAVDEAKAAGTLLKNQTIGYGDIKSYNQSFMQMLGDKIRLGAEKVNQAQIDTFLKQAEQDMKEKEKEKLSYIVQQEFEKIGLIKSQVKLNQSQTASLASGIKLMAAQIENLRADTAYKNSQQRESAARAIAQEFYNNLSYKFGLPVDKVSLENLALKLALDDPRYANELINNFDIYYQSMIDAGTKVTNPLAGATRGILRRLNKGNTSSKKSNPKKVVNKRVVVTPADARKIYGIWR